MEHKKIMDMLNEVINAKDVNIEKIPNIDLYIDQVTNFIEESVKQFKRNDEQKIITKTMVNNYTKDKILSSPVKKKYDKKQVIMLILIYHLKNILSINDIGRLLSSFEENIEDVYSKLFEYKDVSDEFFDKNIEKLIGNFENQQKYDNIDLLILVITLINEANSRKRLAEKIIDTYF